MENATKVCVTAGSGYIGSWLVKKLLERGYTVHATLRNLGDERKVGLLKSLPHADNRLNLFQADIYSPHDFDRAIQGCQYVFHLATPFLHNPNSTQFKSTAEAAVAGVKSILASCIRSGTVRRLIYTASVLAASPLRDVHGKCYGDVMDESCWTPLNVSVPYSNDFLMDYVNSKTQSEKELLLRGHEDSGGKIEIVSLACGLVGGTNAILSTLAEGPRMLIAQATHDRMRYGALRFLEEVLGKVPVVHIEDVCEAHIFCAFRTQPPSQGRLLCASDYVKTSDIARHLQELCPDTIRVPPELTEETGREIVWGSSKLEDMGFEYKYGLKSLLEDTVNYALHCGEWAPKLLVD